MQRLADVQADEHACLLHLNSTYMDMVDCWNSTRGGMPMTLGLFIGFPAMIWCAGRIFFAVPILLRDSALGGAIILMVAGCADLAVVIWLFWKFIRPEFFSYTHYPIRFNRKTRMIHVFRRNSVLSVPWDEAWFNIGKGLYQRMPMRDLRGQVIQGDTVVDSFAVGGFSDCKHTIELEQTWKFIVLYMEQGPQALPADNDIALSMDRSLYNQILGACIDCSIEVPIPIVNWLFIPPITFIRWLIMKSCKDPVWPPEIEAESAIEPNDPHVWKEPSYHTLRAVLKRDPEAWARYDARLKRLGRK
jgi:hypothetical protein